MAYSWIELLDLVPAGSGLLVWFISPKCLVQVMHCAIHVVDHPLSVRHRRKDPRSWVTQGSSAA